MRILKIIFCLILLIAVLRAFINEAPQINDAATFIGASIPTLGIGGFVGWLLYKELTDNSKKDSNKKD